MTTANSLTQSDIEHIERIVYKNGDDIAISISRSFERLEERMDAVESRLYSRFAEVEDRVEASRQDIADRLGETRTESHMAHSREERESAD